MKEIKNNSLSLIFFLVPLTFSLILKVYLMSLIIAIVISVSFIYHSKKEIKFKIPDSLFAIILIASNLYLFYLSKFSPIFFIPAIILATVALFLYFKENKKNYYRYHSLWHILSSIITSLAILSFGLK